MKLERLLLRRGPWAKSNHCHDASNRSAPIANYRDQAKVSVGISDGIFAKGTGAMPFKPVGYRARRRSSGSEGACLQSLPRVAANP